MPTTLRQPDDRALFDGHLGRKDFGLPSSITGPGMLRSLLRLFKSRNPLDPDIVGERTMDVTFRLVQADDIPHCLSLYRANEAAHFPPGRFEYYEAQLRSREFLTLMATRNEEPVGCCGISYAARVSGTAVLCFGMVAPSHYRQGIGTAQLLVRLALLQPVDGMATVTMTAVPSSFYRRFGVAFIRAAPATDGAFYPLGILRVTASEIDDCRTLLTERQIVYPDVRDQIPRR